MPNNIGLPVIPGLTPEDWRPQEPWQGPPLPEFLHIYWPWFRVPEEGSAALSDLLIEPASVQKDSEVTISVVVTNVGSVVATRNLDLLIEGPATKTRTRAVTVNPGESRRVNFRLTIGKVGDYSVSLDGLSGALSVYTTNGEPPDGEPPDGAVFEYVSGLRKSSFKVPTIWGLKTALKYEVDIKNGSSASGLCSVKFQECMWEPGFPLPPDPLDPANDDNPHWGSWNNFDFTQKHYVNPDWTGGRKDDFTSVVEAEIAPGETRTFWDSKVLTPYTFKDVVVGVEAAIGLGEIRVMR